MYLARKLCTNLKHCSYVSLYWRGDCHFSWSSEPREGLATCSAKREPSFVSYFKTLSIGPVPGFEPATSLSAVTRHVILGSLSNHDDNHNDDFKKNNRFNDQNNSSARAITLFSTFLWCPLHDYDGKSPNLTLYGGRGHTKTNFPSSFLAWIKSLSFQLQEKSPAFDILSGSK